MEWKKCCDKVNRHVDLNDIYQAVGIMVGNKVVDVVESYREVEFVFENGCKECIWGDYVSCKFIGDKTGEVLDVAVSKRGIVVILDGGAVWIYVERPKSIYLRYDNRRKYVWSNDVMLDSG